MAMNYADPPVLPAMLDAVRRADTADLGLAPDNADRLLALCPSEIRETFADTQSRTRPLAAARRALYTLEADLDRRRPALSAS